MIRFVKTMHQMHPYVYFASFIIAVGLFLAVSTLTVNAETSSDALTISPVRSDIEVAPGTSKDVIVTVTNSGAKPVNLQSIQNDFVSGDENGTPALILDPNTSAPVHSLKRFMSPVANIMVPAGESKDIVVKISVPADAQAGGYFGAARFVPLKANSQGQVNMNVSLASLILLRVPGDIVEQLKLTDFDIHERGQTFGSSFFQDSTSIQLKARFENKGNVQVSPFGKISVTKGDNIIYSTDFNPTEPRDVILPDSARSWEVPIKDLKEFGRYTVSATFTYGDDNKTIDIKKSFWVVPWIVIIGAGIALVALFLLVLLSAGVYRLRHRHRKPKLGGGHRRNRR